jgi:hypothetical protein
MNTEIKYKTLAGEYLTEHEIKVLQDHYLKEFYEDSALKKIEYHFHTVLLSYYLSAEEDLSTVIADSQDVYGGSTFYFNKQTAEVYTVWDWEVYDGLVKIEKGKIVYDAQNREIAEQVLDITTLAVIKTTKKYYLEDLGGFAANTPVYNNGTLEFNYNFSNLNIGEISVQVNLGGFELNPYIINASKNVLLHPMIAAVFNWKGNTYYHHALPLIPDNGNTISNLIQ